MRQLQNRSWLLSASSAWNQSINLSDGADQSIHETTIAKQVLASIGLQCLESINQSVRWSRSINTSDNRKTDPGFYRLAVPGINQSLYQKEPIG
jgi:hypothetical protein